MNYLPLVLLSSPYINWLLIIPIIIICSLYVIVRKSANEKRVFRYPNSPVISKAEAPKAVKQGSQQLVQEKSQLEKLILQKLFILNLDDTKYSKQQLLDQLESYFKILCLLLEEAEDEIVILDYIVHGKVLEFANEIIDLNSFYCKYYEIIEKLVKDKKKLKYTRIIQLPINKPNGYNGKNGLEHSIDMMYGPTIAHIKKLIGFENFKLYLFIDPLRTHSEVLIDEKYWFNEIDRYIVNKARPDLLFVNSHEESPEIKIGIKNEVELVQSTILENSLIQITALELFDAISVVQEKVRARDQELQEIR